MGMGENDEKGYTENHDHTSKFYYDHFLTLYKSVNRQYSDLLEASDQKLTLAFNGLDSNARYLLVRLILRTREYFVVDKVKYADIDPITDAFSELIQCRLVEKNPDVILPELLPLLTKIEWVYLIEDNQTLELKKSITRKEVEAAAIEMLSVSHVYQRYSVVRLNTREWLRNLQFLYFSNLHQSLSELILSDLNIRNFEQYSLEANDRLFDSKESVQLTLITHLIKILFDLFFDQKKLVIHCLNLTPSEKGSPIWEQAVCVLRAIRKFNNKGVFVSDNDIDVIVSMLKRQWGYLDERVDEFGFGCPDEECGLTDEESILKLFFLIIIALDRQWQKLCFDQQVSIVYRSFIRRRERYCHQLGHQFERLGNFNLALSVYAFDTNNLSKERTIRILAEQSYNERAFELCQRIIVQGMPNKPLVGKAQDEQLLEFAQFFAHKLSKKSHYAYWPKAKIYEPRVYELRLEKPSKPSVNSGAEESVVEYLERFGNDLLYDSQTKDVSSGDCYFVENNLVMTIFSLCYWSLFYAGVKGAFTQPFQTNPHDLYDDSFLKKRANLKQAIDEELFSNHLLPVGMLLDRWDIKSQFQAPFVSLNAVDKPMLTRALDRIPATDWKVIFDRLWLDLREYRKGFPDLIFFPHSERFSAQYCFVEVKAPNDKLQNHQRRWMKYLDQHDIQHCVVNVKWR